ncbi:unnamed protein product [Owenia fusiformis]|uniref:Protein CUSTOS n=1 Tax=Owenia fusiformis TaxID=6347 RepID=A0A8S4Q488_OWEFU|nr:unnamed protein product [Owenia fusiformis]
MAASMKHASGEDSSSDEDDSRFREAVVEFPQNQVNTGPSGTSGQDGAVNHKVQLAQKPSLRNINTLHVDENELKATPEFKEHIAKNLTALLDRQMECVTEEDNSTNKDEDITEAECSGSFKLLSDVLIKNDVTTNSLDVWKKQKPPKIKKRKKDKYYCESDDESTKVAQAAVTQQFVIEQGKQLLAWEASYRVPDSENPKITVIRRNSSNSETDNIDDINQNTEIKNNAELNSECLDTEIISKVHDLKDVKKCDTGVQSEKKKAKKKRKKTLTGGDDKCERCKRTHSGINW